MAVQRSVEGTPQTDSQAVAQQPASTQAVKTIQQTASALKAEGTQTGATTGQAATQPNQTAPAPIIATVAPLSVPFLAADGSSANQIDVWQRIRNGYAMREQESKLIGPDLEYCVTLPSRL